VEYNNALWYPQGIGTNTGEAPSASSNFWQLLTAENIIYAKIMMADFGKLGSAVFYGDYMFSQYGKTFNENTGEYSCWLRKRFFEACS
jgi:hypothetical protein